MRKSFTFPTVLLCGYGKIGAIKANLWKQLGVTVYVRDKNPQRSEQARRNGFIASTHFETLTTKGLPDDSIVDVSVPAGAHVAALREALQVCTSCRTALIEKPVVSSAAELIELQQLLKELQGRTTIFLDESYYSSQGLARLKREMRARIKKFPVKEIAIDFFKDRVPDVTAGRFTDMVLGAYGVEVPHMLACLKYLGFVKGELIKNTYYINVLGVAGSEGLVCEYKYGDVAVRLTEILGPFSLDHANRTCAPHPELEPVRRVTITFQNDTQLRLDFDPVPTLERYHSRLTISEGGRDRATVVHDDHLHAMLQQVLKHARGEIADRTISRLASMSTAVREARKLMDLRAGADIKDMLA